MWSNKQDVNDYGERVLLLDPNKNRSKGGDRNHQQYTAPPSESIIGGYPTFFQDDAYYTNYQQKKCTICQEPMHLITQLYAPLEDQQLERTLFVFGCNKASCIQSIFQQKDKSDVNGGDSFHLGGGGVLHCVRSQWRRTDGHKQNESVLAAKESQVKMPSTPDLGWGDDDMESSSLGGWGDDCGDDTNDWVDASREEPSSTSMNDLEEMLAAMEATSESSHTKTAQTKTTPKKTTERDSPSSSKEDCCTSATACPNESPCFPSYHLDIYEEPQRAQKGKDANVDDFYEDENIGLASDVDNSRIQKLLSNYLKDEEDEDILTALKGNHSETANEEHGGGGEKFERMNPKDRSFLSFTDRIKRSPNQVIRYAYGGVPMWSIPTPRHLIHNGTKRVDRAHRSLIPPCQCGSSREFEFQLMPSALHCLDVDSHVSSSKPTKNESNDDDELGLMMNRDHGGMNWGAIAVYSCAASCNENREEFLVIQDAVD